MMANICWVIAWESRPAYVSVLEDTKNQSGCNCLCSPQFRSWGISAICIEPSVLISCGHNQWPQTGWFNSRFALQSGSQQAEVKVLAGLWFPLEASGKNPPASQQPQPWLSHHCEKHRLLPHLRSQQPACLVHSLPQVFGELLRMWLLDSRKFPFVLSLWRAVVCFFFFKSWMDVVF